MFDLKAFRRKHKLKQSEVADMFNCGQSNISEIENQGRALTRDQIDILISNYGIAEYNEFVSKVISDELHKEGSKGVPYFEDIQATGSVLSSYDDCLEKATFYIDYEHFNDCTAYIPVVGDSMFPQYCSGEIIAVKRILNFNLLLWGEAYLVVTSDSANGLRTIKQVHWHEDDSKVILRSSNPSYKGDMVVDKSDILFLYLIKGKIKRNQL